MKTNEHLAGTEGETVYRVSTDYNPQGSPVILSDRGLVCSMEAGYHQTRLQDAAFIVTACNSHAANLARIAELERALDSLIDVATRALDQSVTHDGLNNCDALAAARHALKGTK